MLSNLAQHSGHVTVYQMIILSCSLVSEIWPFSPLCVRSSHPSSEPYLSGHLIGLPAHEPSPTPPSSLPPFQSSQKMIFSKIPLQEALVIAKERSKGKYLMVGLEAQPLCLSLKFSSAGSESCP